ncbi:MAG TPA: hypothetical protein VJ724_10635, partial [Tahibacter sp.]|nr:hypothetical protein [Tahibacter sp.]
DDWLARSRATVLDALVRLRRGDPKALDALPALADDARGRGDAQIEFYALNLMAVARGVELPRRAADILVRAGIRAPMREELYTTPDEAPAKKTP